MRLHHVNVVVPPGGTATAVAFWELLGLVRVSKPNANPGAWLDLPDGRQVHVSERPGAVNPDQHVAFVVDDLPALVADLTAAGHPWRADPDAPRGWTADPFGNGVELVQS